MKFSIDRDTFLKTVTQCNIPVVNTGNAALQCCALTAEKILKAGAPDQLTLRSSNSLICIEPICVCVVQEEGDVAVNAKDLRDAVASMPNAAVTVELVKGRLVVSSGRRRCSRETRPSADVPLMPSVEGSRAIKISARELLAIISKLEFIVDNVSKEFRSQMGIFLDILDQKLTAVVIGAHVFGRYDPSGLRLETGPEPFKLLLPDYALKLIRELAEEDEAAMLELRLSPHFAWLASAPALFCFVPPSGEYFDWRTALSGFSSTTVCELQRLAVMESLAALISTTTGDHSYTARMRVADGHLHVESGEEFQDAIPVLLTKDAAELPAFSVNARYFRDAIKAANSNVMLGTESMGQHVTFTATDGLMVIVTLMFPEKATKAEKSEKKK